MEKKKLTADDFPFTVCDEVVVSFANTAAAKRAADIIVAAAMRELQALMAVNPWAIVRKHHPELFDYKIEHGDVDFDYNSMGNSINLLSKDRR